MIFALIACSAKSEIIAVKNMQEVQSKVESVLESQKAQDILVAFDIDMTLIQPDHPAVYYPTLKKYLEDYKFILAQLTPEQKDIALTLTTQIVSQKLVETQTPQIIKNIQDKGIKTIALTASISGKIKGFHKKMVFLRRDQLQKIGIDFSNSLKNFTRVVPFLDFKRYIGSHPMFFHGILSSNGEQHTSKGEVFVALLKHIGSKYETKTRKPGFYPKIVIMVDDKKKHLENIEKCLTAYNSSIIFIGIKYEGAESYASKDISQEDFLKFWKGVADQAKS